MPGNEKTAAFASRGFLAKEPGSLLLGGLGLFGGERDSDLAALEIGFAAFTFDDFVGLLAHGD
jgi:hypothetical protein